MLVEKLILAKSFEPEWILKIQSVLAFVAVQCLNFSTSLYMGSRGRNPYIRQHSVMPLIIFVTVDLQLKNRKY